MLILAIESSCDETAVAIVENGRKVISSEVASQIEDHKIFGGVVPEIASRKHAEVIAGLTTKALNEANLSLTQMDAIAVTHAPGLIGALLVGVNFAKGLSLATNIPLIPVHHLRSHIASNYITHKDLTPPFLCLVVSGGHTNIIEVSDYTKMKIIGQTRDDAAGETFDKAARTMGIPYPGGVQLDKIANDGHDNAFSFPHPKVSGSKYDFSFSGLKTSIINLTHNMLQKSIEIPKADLCASFRKAVVECLTENLEKAAIDKGHKKIVIAGGVSANSLLRKNLKQICLKNNWELYMPSLNLCGDNAAMVGAQAYYEYQCGNIASLDLNASASMPIE